jgi:transposase
MKRGGGGRPDQQHAAAERKREAAHLYATGLSVREISEQIGCSPHTTRVYLRSFRGTQKPGPVRKAETVVIRWKVWEKRRAGTGAQALAKEYGVTINTIYEYLRWCQAQLLDEAAKEARAIDLARLDAIIENMWPKLETGNHQAATTVLRALRQRAEIFGYEAPKRVEINTEGTDTEANAALRKKIEQIRTHNAMVAARLKDDLNSV